MKTLIIYNFKVQFIDQQNSMPYHMEYTAITDSFEEAYKEVKEAIDEHVKEEGDSAYSDIVEMERDIIEGVLS